MSCRAIPLSIISTTPVLLERRACRAPHPSSVQQNLSEPIVSVFVPSNRRQSRQPALYIVSLKDISIAESCMHPNGRYPNTTDDSVIYGSEPL